jgi:uncharacterized protein YehS (DUF1456 family)
MEADWTDQNVHEIARQWRLADALMERVHSLEAWLEKDPPRHFARMLDAALAVRTDVNVVQSRSVDDQEPRLKVAARNASSALAVQAATAA